MESFVKDCAEYAKSFLKGTTNAHIKVEKIDKYIKVYEGNYISTLEAVQKNT